MPASYQQFRVACGVFEHMYQCFMADRVKFAVSMRIRCVRARNKFEVLLFVSVACYFLCCGDVEMNPGPSESGSSGHEQCDTENPTQHTTAEDNTQTESKQVSGHQETTSQLYSGHAHLGQDLGSTILKEIRKMNDKFEDFQQDIGKIKYDIGIINSAFVDLQGRCERLEETTEELKENTKFNKSDIDILFDSKHEQENRTTHLEEKIEKMQSEITDLHSEVDRLEEFSRKDNVRMFGVPYSGGSQPDRESSDDCARIVTDILNSVDGPKQWTPDDIARAHRVGQSKDGKPRTMIVKFSRWKDKMTVLRDKVFRGRLENRGVRLVNDLTKRQLDMVAAAKREGKVAFFKNGRMTIGPKLPDQRSYSQVASSEPDNTSRDKQTQPYTYNQNKQNPTCTHADKPKQNNVGQGWGGGGVKRNDAVNSRRDSDQARSESTGARASSDNPGWGEGARPKRGGGLHSYFTSREHVSPRLTNAKGTGGSFIPRRSERNVNK